MSLVDELKPSLMVARAFGFAPYSFATNNLNRSPIAVCYSLILTVVFMVEVYNYIEDVSFLKWEQKLTKIRILRMFLVTISLLLSCLSSMLGHRRFFRFIKEISKFDAMVNLNPITKRCTVIDWARSMAIPIINGSVVVITAYFNPTVSYWRTTTRAISYNGLFSNACKYWSIISCLLRRYQHINRLVLSGSSPKFIRESPKLREIWILHAHLTDASEEFNSMFSIQIFFWICVIIVNIITRIYRLSSGFTVFMIYDSAMIIVAVLLLTYKLVMCHITAAEVNKVANNLYPSSPKYVPEYLDAQNEESILIGQYFVLRRFHFIAGSGILTIDLPLLLTILGAITTYLGILIKPGSLGARE